MRFFDREKEIKRLHEITEISKKSALVLKGYQIEYKGFSMDDM